MEVSEVRKRLLAAIETARQNHAARRARVDLAARDYENFLRAKATPVFHQLALALGGEGLRFKVFTPAGSIRLVSERSAEDFIEVALDTESDPPLVVGRTSRGRGSRRIDSEKPLRDHAAVADLTEQDVLEFLIAEIPAFVER